MKKLLTLFSLFMFCSGIFAQETNTGSTSSAGASGVPNESAIIAIDTVNTADKYVKIILFSDKSWDYLDLDKPVIDDEEMYADWDTRKIHMQGTPIDSLPDEIDLRLIDSTIHYCMPLDSIKINSTYKYRHGRPHRGIDLKLNRGDTVRAAFDGVVRIAEYSRETGGYGNLIVIRHCNGLETYYAHLSRHLVSSGEIVKAGEPIGIGGSTGRSTGPHLHFETRYQGHAFDPERVFDFTDGVIRDSILDLKKNYFDIRSHYGQTDAEYAAAIAAKYIRIKSGDTLGAIARRNGTTVRNLCALNGIRSTTLLRIGRSLRVR
ncbi:MAG: peptidoglycan DD-metalloendopeptidase family protein [Bacteroidales bacterium]|jgi:murein DD-endopeptidase MepM/ murein hydrolase activator NlpD|nr:peptidoglycan DD-metalloendopeptidase family protein [Bacteroidales bacterium]MCI2121146.1 peptidoglycan DD-metalloendopeptidase family protein [Bacteroidales bacterium]MCI2144735.1 peptidoglycan DD-metalloendopeptidase family protein [Bacteroidales bacterium]